MYNITKNLQRKFETFFVNKMNWRHIPGSNTKYILLDIKEYKGKNVLLDNIEIKKGDIIAELHIDNINAENMDNSIKYLFSTYNKEFSYLAQACRTDSELSRIKGFFGVTILHPFLKRMGFSCFPLENFLYREYMKFWESMLKYSFGKSKVKKKNRSIQPMKCWISSEKIKEKYPIILK